MKKSIQLRDRTKAKRATAKKHRLARLTEERFRAYFKANLKNAYFNYAKQRGVGFHSAGVILAAGLAAGLSVKQIQPKLLVAK